MAASQSRESSIHSFDSLNLKFSWRGLSVDDVMAQLRFPDAPPLRGGTLDLEIDGAWDRGRIGYVNLPLHATFRNTVLQSTSEAALTSAGSNTWHVPIATGIPSDLGTTLDLYFMDASQILGIPYTTEASPRVAIVVNQAELTIDLRGTLRHFALEALCVCRLAQHRCEDIRDRSEECPLVGAKRRTGGQRKDAGDRWRPNFFFSFPEV